MDNWRGERGRAISCSRCAISLQILHSYFHFAIYQIISIEFVANQTLLKQLNDEWDHIAPFLLDFNDTVSLNDQNRVSEIIRKHYLGDKEISKETVQPLIRMMSDRLFNVHFEKAVRLMAKVNKSPVRAYYYNYRAKHSRSDLLSGTTENFGN